jgi:hypothetical protein
VALKILFFVLWIPVAVVASLAVARLARRESRMAGIALLAGAIALAGLVVYPRTVKDTAAAARRYERHRAAQPTREGGPEDCLTMNVHACVRERVWAELRQLIPRHARYYVQTNYGLIRFWTFTSLLPRIAVEDVHDADWVVSYRDDLSTLGVRYSQVRTLKPVYANGTYTLVLAKVAR